MSSLGNLLTNALNIIVNSKPPMAANAIAYENCCLKTADPAVKIDNDNGKINIKAIIIPVQIFILPFFKQ